MDDIERALDIALEAHEGQTDKAGEAYIKHPLRVMQNVESDEEKIVALLHDVVEDSDVTLNDLERHFSTDIVVGVKYLTKKDSESYSEFIERCKENELARKVKIADLRDNMDLERLDNVEPGDFIRLSKYHRSLRKLVSVKNDEVSV